MQLDLLETKKFLEKLSLKAGKFLLENRKKFVVVKQKSKQDIATSVDIEVEKIYLTALFKRFPKFNILSEEIGEIDRKSEYTFIIDPLDGTKDYVRGISLFNTSVALEKNGETLVSVVYRPPENELFSAVKDLGSYLNKQKISPSKTSAIQDSFIYVNLPAYSRNPEAFPVAWQKLKRLGEMTYRIRGLADEHTMCCWVAMGGCDAFVNITGIPRYWDIAAGLFIAKEAGCAITEINGKNITGRKIDSLVVSNAKIHQELLGILQS